MSKNLFSATHVTTLHRLTPRASSRTRILSAALTWTCVAIFLAWKSLHVSWDVDGHVWHGILAGMGLGLLKSRLIFDRAARNILGHIGSKPERACLGGLFSVRNWALIVLMVLFGKTIGALPLSSAVHSGIYIMVACGLGYSSRLLWAAWRSSPLAGE
jgi:hypothetical protein